MKWKFLVEEQMSVYEGIRARVYDRLSTSLSTTEIVNIVTRQDLFVSCVLTNHPERWAPERNLPIKANSRLKGFWDIHKF